MHLGSLSSDSYAALMLSKLPMNQSFYNIACRQKLCLKKEIITAISGLPRVILKTMNKWEGKTDQKIFPDKIFL